MGTAPPPAGLVEAGMDGQPVEPGIEPARVAQSGQVPPGSHQRFLDRVSGEFPVPEDRGARPRPGARGRAGKHREGVMIAPPRPLD